MILASGSLPLAWVVFEGSSVQGQGGEGMLWCGMLLMLVFGAARAAATAARADARHALARLATCKYRR